MKALTVYYRISDASSRKERLPKCTKQYCLQNSLKEFYEFSQAFNIIADSVQENTRDFLVELSKEYKKISVERFNWSSGSKSFLYTLERAISELEIGSPVYFLEDDYLHRTNSYKILMEGLTIADYVTLYDHPDKYINATEPYGNPEISGGGENTKVLLTASSHWKLTNSTTDCFATNTDILSKDKKIWHKINSDYLFDYKTFVYLRKETGRTIASPIPGYSTHAELRFLTPLTNWDDI